MANQMPSNKRVFHLVYNRSAHAGGTGSDGPDHIKNQVLEFARDLRRLTEEFIASIQIAFRGEAVSALKRALNEAQSTAEQMGITNPL